MNISKLEKKLAILICIAFAASLLPLLLISVFDHPCADDFTYGLAAHLTWQNTGSFIQTIVAAAGKVAERYRNWQGTFASIFLMAIQPAVFGEKAYAVTPFLLLFMLCSSTLLLMKELLCGFLHSSKAQNAIVSVTITAASVQLLFSPVEAIYWYNGAIHYVFMYSCMLMMTAALLHHLRTGKLRFLIYSCILAFVVGGGNYITALTAMLLECTIAGFLFVYRKKGYLPIVITFVFSLASLAISGLAPGNSVRQSNFEQLSVFGTILQAFKDGFHFITANISILYVLVLLFLVPVIVHIVYESNVRFRLPLLVPILSYCLVSAMFAPTEYTMRVFYVGRTANVVLLMIHLLGVLNEIYLIGYLTQRWKEKNQTNTFFHNEKTVFIWLVICIVLMGADFALTYKTANYTSVTAVLSWKSGELKAYDQEILDRLEILNQQDTKKVKLAPLVHRPYLLYFDDITENKKDWRNSAMAKYYGKKSVVISPELLP